MPPRMQVPRESILITGAGGMLGHALADAFAEQRRAAVSLNRASLDIADGAAVARTFREHCPTLLLNCAAHTKVDL